MNIEQFEVFRTIAQVKSFTKAAKILNFTQPAISSQIKILEQNYKVNLFERCSNGVKLTDAGRKFFEYGNKILAIHSEMENEIAKIIGFNKEIINLGTSYTAGNYFLPALIIEFKKLNPNAHIRLDIEHSNDILKKIKEKLYDIGIVEGNLMYDRDLEIYKIHSNELVFIAPANDRWLENNSITIDQLIKEPFIAREEDSNLSNYLICYFRNIGVDFNDWNIVTEITNFGTIKEAVIRNNGISIVPLPVAEREIAQGDLVRLNVEDLVLDWDMEVVFRANEQLTGLKEAFLKHIIKQDSFNISPLEKQKIEKKPKKDNTYIKDRKLLAVNS
jgi:DNA-binding transcriptional LysR family regulator